MQSIAQAYKKHDNHFKFVPWVNTLYLFLDKCICLSLYQLVYGKHKKWKSSLGSDWTSIHWTSTRPSSIQPSSLRKLLSEGLLDFQRFLQIVRKHSKFYKTIHIKERKIVFLTEYTTITFMSIFFMLNNLSTIVER